MENSEKYSIIDFNMPPIVGTEGKYIQEAIDSHQISGDGLFTKKCNKWMEDRFNAQKIMLTTSGTTALDMAALLCDIKPGDEVILSSFTFSSTATAFVLVGAKLVFVDIRPDTMNIDENLIEDAITPKTKVIAVTHYAGVSCEMDKIMEIARKYGLKVVEDAAQGVMSSYKGKSLGTIGDFGCYSFHETKNYSMGEGGAIVIQHATDNEKAEILREKGTNRSKFYRGQVDKYTWVDFGDSYLPSELNAAYLWAQLEVAEDIYNDRMNTWNIYNNAFEKYGKNGKGIIELPVIPNECIHNAHMFYLKFADLQKRTAFIDFMKSRNIKPTFHYIPLHSAPAGYKYGRFHGTDNYTTKESERLVRLPLYYHIGEDNIQRVIKTVIEYLEK